MNLILPLRLTPVARLLVLALILTVGFCAWGNNSQGGRETTYGKITNLDGRHRPGT